MQESSPTYAICVTNLNSSGTIRRAMESVLNQLPAELFEVVVTDSESDDGSLVYLKDLFQSKRIHGLRVVRCSRGRGRQLAFEMSAAPYVLANIDMDVVYKPNLMEVLATYHSLFEGKVLSVNGMMVVPRDVAILLGGWNDLDRHEDTELAVRAYEHGLHFIDPTISVIDVHLKRHESFIHRWREAVVSFRDWFRIGMEVRDLPRGSLLHPSVLFGYALSLLSSRYRSPRFSEFYADWRASWARLRSDGQRSP